MAKNTNTRITRCFLSLQDFSFQVQHRAGVLYTMLHPVGPAPSDKGLGAGGPVGDGGVYCDGRPVACTLRKNSIPDATATTVLKEQLSFSTTSVLDSSTVRCCKAGLQKHTHLVANGHSSSSPPSCNLRESIKELYPYSQVSYHFHDSVNAFLYVSCKGNRIRGKLCSLATSPEPPGFSTNLHTSWVTPQRHSAMIPGSQHRPRATRAPHSTSLFPTSRHFLK